MARTQLQRALARPDPMLTFKWEVSSVPRGDKFGVDSSYIESFEVPFSNVRSTNVFFGGGYSYFPEFHDTSAITIVFYADSEGRAMSYLWDWKQAVKSFSTGLYSLPQDGPAGKGFKDTWKVQLLNTKGEVIANVSYFGCWPADTNPITLDQDGTGRVTFSQVFSLDSMEINFVKGPGVK